MHFFFSFHSDEKISRIGSVQLSHSYKFTNSNLQNGKLIFLGSEWIGSTRNTWNFWRFHELGFVKLQLLWKAKDFNTFNRLKSFIWSIIGVEPNFMSWTSLKSLKFRSSGRTMKKVDFQQSRNFGEPEVDVRCRHFILFLMSSLVNSQLNRRMWLLKFGADFQPRIWLASAHVWYKVLIFRFSHSRRKNLWTSTRDEFVDSVVYSAESMVWWNTR